MSLLFWIIIIATVAAILLVGVPLLVHFMGKKDNSPSKDGEGNGEKGGMKSLFGGGGSKDDSKPPKDPAKDDMNKCEKDDKKGMKEGPPPGGNDVPPQQGGVPNS
ncbi:hypothetical protein THOM_1669 [Trachipleistophora hominis]|uniref:Uncharacterized protein n=1 Tax=Trachipleistophora hominis TaxID=72359 RepID=L7JX98_TRAHO|nr:hypothetical protein THOM_1669 [Trachipleistophora hominis]